MPEQMIFVYKVQWNNGKPFYTSDFYDVVRSLKDLKKQRVNGDIFTVEMIRLDKPIEMEEKND